MKKIGFFILMVSISLCGIDKPTRTPWKKFSLKTKLFFTQAKHFVRTHSKLAARAGSFGLVAGGAGATYLIYYLTKKNDASKINGKDTDKKEIILPLDEEQPVTSSSSSLISSPATDRNNNNDGSIRVNSNQSTLKKDAPENSDFQKDQGESKSVQKEKDDLAKKWEGKRDPRSGVRTDIEKRLAKHDRNHPTPNEKLHKDLTANLVKFLRGNNIKNPRSYVAVMQVSDSQKVDDNMTIYFFKDKLNEQQVDHFLNQFNQWVITQERGDSVRVRLYNAKKSNEVFINEYEYELPLALLCDNKEPQK